MATKNMIGVEQALLMVSTVGLVQTQQTGYVRCEESKGAPARFYLGCGAASKRIGRVDLSGFPANIHMQVPGVLPWAEARSLGLVPEAPSKKVTHAVDFRLAEADIHRTIYLLARFLKPRTQEELEDEKVEKEMAEGIAAEEAELAVQAS